MGKITEKIKSIGTWVKKKVLWVLIAVGILGVAYAAFPNDHIPLDLQLEVLKEEVLFNRIVLEDDKQVVEYTYNSGVVVPQEDGEDLPKRTKNAKFFKQNKTEWKGRFYAGEPFYYDSIDNEWYQTEIGTTTIEAFEEQTKVGLLERLFFPKAMAATTSIFAGSGDGYAATWEAEADFNTAHDLASGNDSNTAATAAYITTELSGTWIISRNFFPVDTSALGATADISAAAFYVYGVTIYDNDNDAQAYLAVVETFQVATNALENGDYEDCGSDNGTAGRAKEPNIEKGSGDIDITGFSTVAYTEFQLNATGIGWISKTGTTKIGIREGHDIEELAADAQSGLTVYHSEQTDTDKDPYLEIVYTVSSDEAPTRNRVIIIE